MYKKRYIYSAVTSSIFFAFLYIILNINVFISLIISVIAYIGGIFWFKEKDIRKYDPNLIMHYSFLISKINNYINYIDDKKIQDKILSIVDLSDKIINMLEQKPNKVTQVYDGFDFYLPTIVNVLEQYVILLKRKKLNDVEKKFIIDVDTCLNNLNLEIKNLFDNMNYTKMLDINSRINMFKKDNNIVENKIVKEN